MMNTDGSPCFLEDSLNFIIGKYACWDILLFYILIPTDCIFSNHGLFADNNVWVIKIIVLFIDR